MSSVKQDEREGHEVSPNSGGSRPRKEVDDLDRKIISALRKDGRETATELGRRFGVTEATIRNRIDRLVNDGVMRVVAVVNPHKLGYNCDTFITLKVDADKIIDAADRLAEMEEIRYVGIASGSSDVIIAAFFRSNEELLEFLTSRLGAVPGIRHGETSHLLKVVKRTYDWIRPEQQR
ncbi:MAG: Lrp/AsnC family transcriptional regulator [Chloroflexi bacterium]|nr:Lrp/AsnC family transcriptional regulator [Chloroflexota bacterium]